MTPAAQVLGVQAESAQAERDRVAACVRAAGLVCQCHDFDPLDDAFAHLAPGYPQAKQCWCGHPESRHWASEQMTLGAGCHDCVGWDGAHRYGRELPWAPETEATS